MIWLYFWCGFIAFVVLSIPVAVFLGKRAERLAALDDYEDIEEEYLEEEDEELEALEDEGEELEALEPEEAEEFEDLEELT